MKKATSVTFARAILLLVVYSAGLALPFLLAALSFGEHQSAHEQQHCAAKQVDLAHRQAQLLKQCCTAAGAGAD